MGIKSKRNTYAFWEYFCLAMEFVAVVIPYGIVIAINYQRYFIQYDGWKVSLAFVLFVIMASIAIIAMAKDKFRGNFLSVIITWSIFAFIFTMLGEIITDLAMIMWMGLIGLFISYALDCVSRKFRERKTLYNSAISEAEKDDLKERMRAEMEQRKEAKRLKVVVKERKGDQ